MNFPSELILAFFFLFFYARWQALMMCEARWRTLHSHHLVQTAGFSVSIHKSTSYTYTYTYTYTCTCTCTCTYTYTDTYTSTYTCACVRVRVRQSVCALGACFFVLMFLCMWSCGCVACVVSLCVSVCLCVWLCACLSVCLSLCLCQCAFCLREEHPQLKWMLGYVHLQPPVILKVLQETAFGLERWWTQPEKGIVRENSGGGSWWCWRANRSLY